MRHILLATAVIFLTQTVIYTPFVKAELFVKSKKEEEEQPETLKNDGSTPQEEQQQAGSSDTPPEQEKKSPPKQVFVPQKPKSKELSSKQIDKIVIIHTQDIAAYCIGAWQSQKCMKALSRSNLTLASLYAETLNKNKKKKAQDALLENCSASTAATKVDVPAYAMKSAMTTCANAIYDITEATKIKPNPTHFQLMIEPIFCLGGEERCEKFEELLRNVISQTMSAPKE